MEVPDYYEDVSVRLTRVLDTSGFGEKARWKRIELSIQCEKLHNLTSFPFKLNMFVSQAEATAMGFKSDIDMIVLDDSITVLQDLQLWIPGSEIFLMITDSTTSPGYVKLQSLYDNAPIPISNEQTDILMLDAYGRSVLYNEHEGVKIRDSTHHGPANTTYHNSGFSSDFVFAYRVVSWPYMALEWIIRNRNHNWPSQETVAVIRQSGALLVPVGQQISPESHLEWRISLSYGEKTLVWQFSSSQYKCYVLLKLINTYFIKPKVGDNVLTSYHCKTCMFYMIESTPATLWQPQNVLICIELCLRMLRTWVEEGNCPNYFIPEENMFLGKVYGHIQSYLVNVLHDLIRLKGKYLTVIPYDKIGQKLTRACQSHVTEFYHEQKHFTSTLFAVKHILILLLYAWFKLLDNGGLINPLILERTSSSHVIQQEVSSILISFCCSSLGSYLASKCWKEEIIDQEGLDFAHRFLLLGSSSDVASGKLKLATFYLMQNNVILAENILQNIEKNYTFLGSNVQKEFTNHLILLRIENENLSTTELVRHYSAFPVPYLPSEIHCTPRALIPEMFRSTGSYQGSLHPDIYYWQSWAVVDPKFYLHFLEHQCYHHQYKIPQKMAALDNMMWVIRYERLEYKDTALNLLAYCLTNEGLLVEAYRVLSKSMKLKNHHNASKWQIGCLINAAFRCLGGRH